MDFWTVLWHGLPVVALFIWGAFCITNNLWYDEAYSASMVSLSWKRLIYITATDDHSPFYYVLLKLFYHLCGGGTHFWALKLMSVLFMLGYMLLGKYYVEKLFDRKISVYFMLFSLLMPIFSVQAGNVRMYAVALFFLTLTGLSAYDIFREATHRKWIVFCIASICTVYCHTFALIQTFLFYMLFLAAILICRKKELVKGYFISGFTVAIVFSPWLAVTCRQFILRMRYDDGSVSELATLNSVMDYCKEWFSAVETPIGIVVLLGLAICLILSYGAVDWVRQHHNAAPAITASAFALTGIVGGVISATVNNCFMGRYASRECALSCCGMRWDFHRSWIPQKKKTKNGGSAVSLHRQCFVFCCNMYRRSGWNMMTDCKNTKILSKNRSRKTMPLSDRIPIRSF